MDIMRKCFTVGFAGFKFELDTPSTSACVLCKDYLLEGIPDIRIKVTEQDVNNEYIESKLSKPNKVSAETGAVYRKIAEEVLNYDTLLMHGAVIATGENAYMFSAPSGTGKTTHIKLWLENDRESFVVNGDKPLIRIIKDKAFACGTPWSGSEGMDTNRMVPLKSIILMERSEKNHIEEIDFAQAYLFLLQQTFIPKEASKAKKALSLLSSLHNKLSLYRFRCNNYEEDCFAVSYNALVRDKNG